MYIISISVVGFAMVLIGQVFVKSYLTDVR